MGKFKEATLNEKRYDRNKDTVQRWRDSANSLIMRLREEGAPTDLKFILEITESENAFGDWVNQIYKERTETVFLPKEERNRVRQIYAELFDRVNPAASNVRAARETGAVLIEKDGIVSIDEQKAERWAIDGSTDRHDVETLQAYWAAVSPYLEARRRLRAYESANGLPNSLEGGQELMSSFENADEAEFQKRFGAYFIKKNNL